MLYILNQNLYVGGNVTFDSNTAKHRRGIFVSNHSTITFSKNSVVTFNQNATNNNGGVIALNHFSSATFEANCVVMFNNNTAGQSCGGSIYSYNNSNIILKGNTSIHFNKNVAKFGGALCLEANSTFTVENDASVTFNSNEADLGGAIYIDNSSVIFKANLLRSFDINEQDVNNFLYSTYKLTNNNNMTAVFINNKAIQGGAVYVR